MTRTAWREKIQILGAFQKYPAFKYLWVSNFCFFAGNWMQVLVLGWLAYDITGSPWLLALFTTARLLPFLLGPIGGLLADRMDRVKLILYFVILNLVVTGVMVILVMTGSLEFWHLTLIGLGLGLALSPADPARLSLVMDIVGKEDVSNAVSLNTIGVLVPMAIGPLIGGLLLRWLDPTLTLVLSSLWFLVAIATLLPILKVGRERVMGSHGSPLRDLIEGFRIVLGNRDMAIILLICLIANIFVWPIFQTFLPVFAKDVLSLGPDGLGFLMAAFGAGQLVAAIYIASLGDFGWKGQLYVWGTVGFGLFFALFALSTSFPLSLLLISLAGFSSAAFAVMMFSLMLILAPEEVRGRAMGVLGLAIGVLPLATIIQGAVANVIGVPLMTTLAGSILALSMVGVYLAIPSLRRLR